MNEAFAKGGLAMRIGDFETGKSSIKGAKIPVDREECQISSLLCRVATIMLLDRHATVANPQFITTELFHERFREFIAALDMHGYPDSYLEEENGPIIKEYWAFHRAVDAEVAKEY